jgi:quinohemoprotein ethanol dehydrogenase
VYVPAQDIAAPYGRDPEWVYRPGEFNTGIDLRVTALWSRELADGFLLAWDPVAQREVWRHPHGMPWNGGTLTTAGNLVFQGTADGRFLALRADDGKLLWTSHAAGTGIIAAPVTYSVDGTQYVTVVAGWGGAFAIVAGDAAEAAGVESEGVVLTWALSDQVVSGEMIERFLAARPAERARGEDLYHLWCSRCHGATARAGGVNPDLRAALARLDDEAFIAIALAGLPGTSMPPHAQWITRQDAEAIRDYVRSQAR